MDYINYSAEEIAALESFQDYYLRGNKEARVFWERWVAENPQKVEAVETAKKLLDLLRTNVSKTEIRVAFSKLEQAIDRPTAKKVALRSNRRRKLFRFVAATAAAVALLLAVPFLWTSSPEPIWRYSETGFGEMRELELPDGSVVYLNSNSSIKYDSVWTTETKREVWLAGEAFFKVRKQPKTGSPKFVVHGHDTEVQVLGTVFNVYNRDEQVAVVLESGRVVVQYDQDGTARTQEMMPNAIFEINAQDQVSYRSSINTAVYTSWKDNKLVLEDTPLRKVVNILEENFGFEVMVENQDILERKLTATIPIMDINIVLDALREIYGLKIKKEEQRILIQ